jgi:pilus assembly protein Flp/PilA
VKRGVNRRTADVDKLTRQMVVFLRREDGPTAVEYAVMLALIIVVCLGSIAILGKNSNNTYTSVGKTVGS